MRIFRLFGLCLALISTVSAAPLLRQDGQITYNQTVEGQLSQSHTEDLWEFSGRAGDLILINMQSRNADNLDTYLALSNSGGSALMTDDDSGEGFNSRIGPYALPEDGRYEISATSYSGSGEYSLQLINLETRPVLKAGKSLVGAVDLAQPAEYFLVESSGETDNLYRVSVTDDEAFTDPVLAVYDLDGFINSTEYMTESVIDPLVTVPDQTYVVVVSYNSYSEGSAYEITLTPSEIDLLEQGVIQSGSLDYQNYNRQHFFRAEMGQVIRVTVTTMSGDIAPAVEVKTADFEYIMFSGQGISLRQTLVEFEAPASTIYSIGVRDSSYESGEGTYDVLVEVIDGE